MIQVLDQATIDKIAAGEVVERPASVVKELIENSIDSGATAITVEIKDGGISFIRVTDNGCGIPAEQVQTAFLRHATSKIQTIEDLLTASSLGFRGEALSSIAAVGQVELITKTGSSLTGVRYVIHGGQEQSMEEIGCPEGTTFILRNLFYNTPARRKFLKTAMTEAGYVTELVEQIAMSRPDISVKFVNNGQNKLSTSGNGSLKDILYHVYGREIAKNLLPIEVSRDGMTLSGYVAKPYISRGNRSFEHYYVNGRYIKSPIITKAIEEAYKTFVMIHKFPFVALNITVDSRLLDVNVHPRKMEMRYSQGDALYKFIFEEIRHTLLQRELIPDVGEEAKAGKESQKAGQQKTGAERGMRASGPEPFEVNRRNQELQTVYGLRQTASDTAGTGITEASATMQAGGKEPDTVTQAGAAQTGAIEPSVVAQTGTGEAGAVQTGAMEPSVVMQTGTGDAGTAQASAMKPSVVAQTGTSDAGTAQADAIEPHIVTQSDTAIRAGVTEAGEPQVVSPSLEASTLQVREENAYKASLAKEAPQLSLFASGFLTEEARPKHRLIGQLFRTYWLIEYEDNLFIMDQHAAHEKVMYETLMKQYQNRQVVSQQIHPPIVISVNPRQQQILKEHYDFFESMGFQMETFGGNEYMLRAVPLETYGLAAQDIFIDFVDSLLEDGTHLNMDLFIYKIATMACKAAVKGNMKLTTQEADALIDQLLQLENPYNCPHGRPTIIAMTETELEKKFRRIQN